MCVRIDESRQHSLAREIDFAAARVRKVENFFIRTDSEESAIAYGYGLRSWRSRIDGPEISVVKNKVRFLALERH